LGRHAGFHVVVERLLLRAQSVRGNRGQAHGNLSI
jgi:hypothetical protein